MGFQADIANALLEVIKGCVDCTKYDRVLWQLGDPTIECSTLGIGLVSFSPVAEVASCVVNELRMNLVVAQCCQPLGGPDGTPPPEVDIIEAAQCVVDDVERILCCINSMSIQIPGAVKDCRPKVMTPTYSRPSGGCLVAKIGMNIVGVPCCD